MHNYSNIFLALIFKMQEDLIKQLNKLQFDSCRRLKSLQDLRSGKALCEILAFAKSKPLPKNQSPEDFLKLNCNIKSLKHMTADQLEVTAKTILKCLPRQVPLLDLKNLQTPTRATSATQRSYLTSHKNKLRKDLTPSTKRPPEAEIYTWIRRQGFQSNILKDVQSGVLLCELINKQEKKQVLREFFKPAKTLNASKMNLRKVFTYLKSQNFDSKFLDFSEVLGGSETYIIGLLQDLRQFYDKKIGPGNEENDLKSELKVRKWVDSLGLNWETFSKPSKIGELIIKIIEKCYKVQITSHFPSDSIENSKKNIDLALKTLAGLSPGLSLKYYKDSSLILTTSSVFFTFLHDIHNNYSEKFSSTDPRAVILWLNSLKLLNSSHLYEIVPKCRTGEFFVMLAELLTGESLKFNEPKGTFQRLSNLRMAFEVLFSYNLIRNVDEGVILNIASGDLNTITGVLTLIKNIVENCEGEKVLDKPQEFLYKVKSFRSVTPPKTMIDI